MHPTVPTRHPSSPRPVPALVRVFATLIGAKPLTESGWNRLGEALTVGDEPMDRLVEWMASAGMHTARPLFERALNEGIDSVPNAPEPLRSFFERYEATPAWLDMEKIRRGQRAMRISGADGMYIARDVALLGGYQFAGFNKTLLRTGALRKGSNKRFTETAQWAMDVIATDGLEPLGSGYRSTIRVRMIHAFVRRQVAAMPDWQAEDWGLPVNQTDMIATLLGALIAPNAAGVGMGILRPPADFDAIAHMTRYVGWLMGVEEQWLPTTFSEAVATLAHTLTALAEPDETTRLLSIPMSNDPLGWNYPRLQGLRRRIARSQHLSVTNFFLGPATMRTLGLPAFVPPWYPILRFPINATRSLAAVTVPGGMDRAADRGWQEMLDMMRTMGGTDAKIGASAAHITRAA